MFQMLCAGKNQTMNAAKSVRPDIRKMPNIQKMHFTKKNASLQMQGQLKISRKK